MTERKLRMGMVGGGPGAFIGPVHRIAAELDGCIELVAGAFSSSAEKSKQAGASYRIDPARAYGSYTEMFAQEKQRADGIDFVVIATPNNTHLPIAKAALEAGMPVVSDKPATATYDEALELERIVHSAGLPYALTHTYAGYPLVRDARAICASGELGEIRKIAVEYLQGWLSAPLEQTGMKQAEWRVDPAVSGPGGCIGDIGTHAFHLAEYITGLDVVALHATLRSVIPSRRVDDDCTALLKMSNGAQGVLMASQIAAGEGNGLRIRIYGQSASLHWEQETPNTLTIRRNSGPDETRHAGCITWAATPSARRGCRAGIPKATSKPSPCCIASSGNGWKDGAPPGPKLRPRCRVSVPGSAACSLSSEPLKASSAKPGSSSNRIIFMALCAPCPLQSRLSDCWVGTSYQ